MPFLDEIDDVRDKIPCGRLPRPVLAGIACIAVAIVVLAALGVASSARGDFMVESSASSSSAARSMVVADAASTATGDWADAASLAGGQSAAEFPSTCYVYVVGAVKKPGVYEVPAGARVNDAVELAGGMTKKADAAAVNLARVIGDGEQITIPEKGSASVQSGTGESAVPVGETHASSSTSGGKVNINSASPEELKTLPGIGDATAAKIIASRESEGSFQKPEDLKRISGIGDKKYAAVADLITV